MRKVLEKFKNIRLQFEKWLKDNKDSLFLNVIRIIPIALIILALSINSCKNDKTTAYAETSSNGFNITLPVMVSSFYSYSSTDDLPHYVFGYNSGYSINVNFFSTSSSSYIQFNTLGGDGSLVSPNFTIIEGRTVYSYYTIYTSTSPYKNSYLIYAENMFYFSFRSIRSLSLSLDCVSIDSVTSRFSDITAARFNSPYSLSTLSFYRCTLRGDYGANDNRTWFLEIFVPIQVEDYALFNNKSSLFVDLSDNSANQFEQGYNAGVKASQTESYNRGFQTGYSQGDSHGYSRGIEEQLSNVSPLRVVFNSISDILKLEIVPYVKLGYLLTLVIGVLAISLVLKRG
jgi:hypothetical protein